MKIKSITLKGFRGATQSANVVFDTSKSLSLIFGENGTGKSTIIDGFDFLCNKNIGSLETYSFGRTPVEKFIPSHGNIPANCFIELNTENGKWKATLAGKVITITPENDIPSARILRRAAILRLIEQEPKARFEELKSFINVPNTDKVESVFRDAIKDTERLFNEYTRALSQANEALDKLWNDARKQGSSSISWAETRVKANTAEDQKTINSIETLLRLIANTVTSLSSLKTAITNEEIAVKSEVSAKASQKAFEEKQKEKDSDLLTLLQKAHSYISGHSAMGKCPVCETEQDINNLLKSVSTRMSEMNEVKTLSTATQQASSQVEAKKTLRINSEIDFIAKLKLFLNEASLISSDIGSLLNLEKKFVSIGKDSTEYSSVLSDSFATWHASFLSSGKSKIEEKKGEYQNSISLKSTIQNHLDIVREKEVLAKTKEKTLSELKDILQIIEKERKEYIEGILTLISQEVSNLYSTLHPDEQLGGARFYLKPNQIGSLEFDASFQGAVEIPPQAYYSESHLDTLGICVFIALSKHYKNDNTILILDDVLTSVDAQHMDRFMKMLHEQSKVFNQIIVTTHYRPWKDRYKYTRSAVSNIDVIELGPWSLQTGIQVSQFKEAVIELKNSISVGNFDRQAIASKAGVVLESMLEFITRKYRCLLPYDGTAEHTLGDFVGGIDSKLSKLLKIKKNGKETELKPLLDTSISAQWIRNCVGCHFNLKGSDVTDQEVKDFANSVIEIADSIICPDCYSLPKRNSGSFWHCSCKDNQLELHPLTQPGATPRSIDDGE
jgi:energy-coupling factor transporter ATP-binding protein EcfA2